MGGTQVFFPSTPPVLNGTSIVFPPPGDADKAMVMPLVGAGVIGAADTYSVAITLNLTRLARQSCQSAECAADHDPGLTLSDGNYLVGAYAEDNNNGSAVPVTLIDAGGASTSSRILSPAVFANAGYPSIGSAFDVTVTFTVAPGETSGTVGFYGSSGQYSEIPRALDATAGLAFILEREQDGEQYQINWMTIDGVLVPEPATFALAGAALLGVAVTRRRKATIHT
jgi:hypothetical protein